jgi:mono/diheme cytochrome c family protein
MRLRKILPSLPLFTVCLLLFHLLSLHAQQTTAAAGKKLFIQKCSVCHLPPLGVRPESPYARVLTGYMKGPESETRAREVIRKGTSGTPGMPGFQYTLEPEQIESIIAYLNTLK